MTHAQGFTLNAKHGLGGSPNAHAQGFTLNAGYGWDGSPITHAQGFTLNAKHGLGGSPNAHAQGFTLNAGHGWDGSTITHARGLHSMRSMEGGVAKCKCTGFYKEWGSWMKNQRRFSEKIKGQIDLYTVQKNARPQLPVYSG
jgi:hypothetical protein